MNPLENIIRSLNRIGVSEKKQRIGSYFSEYSNYISSSLKEEELVRSFLNTLYSMQKEIEISEKSKELETSQTTFIGFVNMYKHPNPHLQLFVNINYNKKVGRDPIQSLYDQGSRAVVLPVSPNHFSSEAYKILQMHLDFKCTPPTPGAMGTHVPSGLVVLVDLMVGDPLDPYPIEIKDRSIRVFLKPLASYLNPTYVSGELYNNLLKASRVFHLPPRPLFKKSRAKLVESLKNSKKDTILQAAGRVESGKIEKEDIALLTSFLS